MRKEFGVFRLETLVTVLVLALGITVVSGWLLHVIPMVAIVHGMVPLVFNTGAGFTLAGTAFLLSIQSSPRVRKLCLPIGFFLLAYGIATLFEHIFDASFGIDFAHLHQWYDYGNTRPGRMAPNTATGFILIGIANILNHHIGSKVRAGALIIVTFCLLIIGLTGFIGYFASPELLFGWARSARMALPTAFGMVLCGIRFWVSWSGTEWFRSREHFHEAEKIRYLGPAILFVAAIAAGLAGFVFMQRSLDRVLETNLEAELKSRTNLFWIMVGQFEGDSQVAIRLNSFEEVGREILSSSASTQESVNRFKTLSDRLVDAGFLGVALQTVTGERLALSGYLSMTPKIETALNESGTSTLIWNGEMIFRTYWPLKQNNQLLGEIIIDQSAAALDNQIFDPNTLGKTGEVALCIPHNDNNELKCFPGRRHDEPFVVPVYNKLGLPLPMKLALAGERGHISAVDYRGQNVIAAYGPLTANLGLVTKQETIELFGVIRHALAFGAPSTFFIGLIGAALLYLQLKPLVAQMRTAEQSANEKELKLRTILDAAGEGIITFNERLIIQSANPAACEIFGYSSQEFVGQHISILAPDSLKNQYTNQFKQYIKGELTRFVSRPNIEVINRRKDGTEFPLEVTVKEITIDGGHWLVAVVRDITERKRMQEKLSALALYDSLTRLPNRTLFMEKLLGGALRAERSQTNLALMFLDLDGFKQVNDSLGHLAGDELLIQFAQRLSATVRKVDTVARLAGDEFTILLEELSQPSDIELIAKKIIDVVQVPFKLGPHTAHVTVSIGIVIRQSSAGPLDFKKFLKEADAQMYVAKHSGKNRYSLKLI